MELNDLTKKLDNTKDLNLFTEDDVKNIEEIQDKMKDYLEKGEEIESEIRKAKSSNKPSFDNTVENIKDTIQESILANSARDAVEKFGKSNMGKTVMSKLQKPIEFVKNIIVKFGKIAYNLGKKIFVK